MSRRRSRWKRAILLVVGYGVVVGFSTFIFAEKIWIAYIVMGVLAVCLAFLDPKIFSKKK